jgi:hypothetical protein
MWTILVSALAMCPRPNITDNGQFCIPGPSYLYNFDDRFSINNGNRCLGTGRCGDGDGYHVQGVHGQFCACSFNENSPDPILRQGTQYIVCEGTGNPSSATLRGRSIDLNAEDGDTAKLVEIINEFHPTASHKVTLNGGACPAFAAACVGFYSTTSVPGLPHRLWGICQPRRESGNATDPFFYPVQQSRKTEMDGGTPCNCHGRKPLWKSFRQKTFTDETEAIYERVTHEAKVKGPCETVRVGWGWDDPVDDSIDPAILTIPPGSRDADKTVYEVEKTGTLKDVPGQDHKVPCGRQEHRPLGSLTLKEYCAQRPYEAGSIAAASTYGDAYNVEASARLYAVRNLQSLEDRLREQVLNEPDGAIEYLGIRLTRSQPSITDAFARLHDGSNDVIKYKFALALLNEEMRWGTADVMQRYPPSFHGSEAFPTEILPEFHIGSRNFSLITDKDGTVSPFRLLLYHFSTSVVDYGVLFNTFDGESVDFNEEGVRNFAGSFLGQPVEPIPTLKSGFNHYFMGLMPGILGRLTLPGRRSVSTDCHHPVLETLKKRGNAAAGKVGLPTIEFGCKVASDLRANVGLQGLLTDPDHHNLKDLFPIAQEMGRVSGLHEIYLTAAKVDIMEQLFQIIRYAVPDMLTQGFWESVRSQMADKNYPLFARSSETCPEKLRYVAERGVYCFRDPDPLNRRCGLGGYGCVSLDWHPAQSGGLDDTINPTIVNKFQILCNTNNNCVGFAYTPAARLKDDDHGPMARAFSSDEKHTHCFDVNSAGLYGRNFPQHQRFFDSVFYHKYGQADSNFSGCLAGITTILNASSNYQVYTADPTWSNRMWRPHNTDVWERLCTIVHKPSANIAFPSDARQFYDRSGCDLSSLDALYKSASKEPIDFYTLGAGCQVPTVLSYSLHPTSRLTRITRSVLMSEAVATAAWPGLPVERVLQYAGWEKGVVDGTTQPGPGGRCNATDEWILIVNHIPEFRFASYEQILHACKMPYQKAVLYSFADELYCGFSCVNHELQCETMPASTFCLAVEGFGRVSSPKHGFASERFNMTYDHLKWHVSEATAEVFGLAHSHPNTNLDNRGKLLSHINNVDLSEWHPDASASDNDRRKMRKAAQEELVVPQLKFCPEPTDGSHCVKVSRCLEFLTFHSGRFQTTADVRLLDFFQDLNKTRLADACARHAAVGLTLYPDHPQRADCYDFHYNLLVIAVSQDMMAALAKGTGTFVPGKYGNSGWELFTFFMRRFHARLSAGQAISELERNISTEKIADYVRFVVQKGSHGDLSKLKDSYDNNKGFDEGDLLGAGTNYDDNNPHRATDFKYYIDWIYSTMLPENYFGGQLTVNNVLMGINGHVHCEVTATEPMDPFREFGLLHADLHDANHHTNSQGALNEQDKANNAVVYQRRRALTQFLLRAHIRRGTPFPSLLRSRVVTPILGCSMHTTHYRAPKDDTGRQGKQRADCGSPPSDETKEQLRVAKQKRDAFQAQTARFQDNFFLKPIYDDQLQTYQDDVNTILNQIREEGKAGIFCVPEGGFGQRVPFGDFTAQAKENFQKPKFDAATNKTTFPGGYEGPIHNTLRSVPVGTPALLIGNPEETADKVNAVLFDSNLWRHVYDYATLRAGTTAYATIASTQVPTEMPPPSKEAPEPGKLPHRAETYWESVANAINDGPSCYFHRCNDAITTYHNGDSMVHARLVDVESMAGACYPGQNVQDQDTTALYRRRHFIRLTPTELHALDSTNGHIYSVDGHGRARGRLPGGCRYQRRNDPPPPPPPPPPPWWEVVVGAVLVIAAVVVPPFGGGFGKAALLAAGVGLITDFAIDEDNKEATGSLQCANTGWIAGMESACAPIGHRHPKSRLTRDGTATYLGLQVDTRDVDGSDNLERSMCTEPKPRFTDEIEFPDQIAPTFLSKLEFGAAGDTMLHNNLFQGDQDGVFVGVPGNGIMLAQTEKIFKDMPGNQIATFRQGEPDGITFFDERAMLFPRIWRLASERVGAERPEFLDPKAAFGFSPKQMAALCAQQATNASCFRHRGCYMTATGCRSRGDIDWDTLCNGLTNECDTTYGCIIEHGECNADKEANWVDCRPRVNVPCSDLRYPVCVEVTILPHEGMSLNAAGTIYAMQGSSDTSDATVCVPITRKLELNTENIQQRFEEGHLWRTNCVYNPRASGCSLPPLRLRDLIENFNLQEMSNQLRVHAPMSFISQSNPPVQLRWGNTHAMTANGVGNDELAHKEWFEAKVDVAAIYPYAGTPEDGQLTINCGPDSDASDCALLIDDITKVNCARIPRGKWPGTCLKPELQLQTPHDITDTMRDESIRGFLRGPFRNFQTPVRRECPVYEAHSLQLAEAFDTYFSRDTCSWFHEAVPGTEELNAKAMYVHYCAKYVGLYAHCDNDYLSNAKRKEICEREAGPYLYTGLVLQELSIEDLCNPATRTCFAIPGRHKLGGFNRLLAAAEERYGDLTGYTFVGTSVDISVLKQILFGATIENTINLNAPVPHAEKSRKLACDPKRTCMCCSDLNTCCTTCTKKNIEDMEADTGIKDRLISGQALYERSELIGEQICNRDVPPVASLFENISAIGPLWRSSSETYDAERRVYKIVGVDFPNHDRTVTSVVEHPESVFKAKMRNDGLVVIRHPEITFRHIDRNGTLFFGTQRLEVRATGFKIYNATFDGPGPGIRFEGSTVANAHVYNVTAPEAQLAVAFRGAVGTGGVYSPFTDVSNVVIEHTTGKRFMAGFARTKGIATIAGCAATLSGSCLVPHVYGPCRTWASAYGPPLEHAPLENWEPNGTMYLTNPNGDLVVDGHAVYYFNNRLHAGTLCLAPDETYVRRVHCDVAPYATSTGHFEGAPFFCIKLIQGEARYAPCAGCNVGMGHHTPCDSFDTTSHTVLNRTHCEADGVVVTCTSCGLERAACVSRPVGHQILGCTSRPHGAVHNYTSNRTGVFTITDGGGYGALYDGDKKRVLVGGYGYTHGGAVQTQRVLIEPAEHTTVFDIRTTAAEVVNVTEYTSVFGAAYERSVFHPERNARSLKIVATFVAGCVIALIVTAHVYLTFDRAKLYMTSEPENTEAYMGKTIKVVSHGKLFIEKGFPIRSLVHFQEAGKEYRGLLHEDKISYNDNLNSNLATLRPKGDVTHHVKMQVNAQTLQKTFVFDRDSHLQLQGPQLNRVEHESGALSWY